jgi:putative transposase
MPLQGRLSIENMCQLVALSRRGFYRSLQQREPAEEETEVRSLIQQIALEHRRRYGYRRITAELHRRTVASRFIVRVHRGPLLTREHPVGKK